MTAHRKELASELNAVTKAANKCETHGERQYEPQPGEQKQEQQAQEQPQPEAALPSRCPMSRIKKGGLAALLAASAMLPGHDAPPKAEQQPARVRKWSDMQNREADEPPAPGFKR